MKTRAAFRPLVMGAFMALMVLGMAHMIMTGSSTLGPGALVAFVLFHVLILVLLATAGIWLMRLSPRLHALLARVHRPSLGHFLNMLAGAAIAAGLTHLILHGGL